jgi:plasmid maintenance system antidote protein VapI
MPKTLDEWLAPLGWDAGKLAREADISYNTARKAIDGDAVTARTARAIAAAIGEATGQIVNVGDIRGLVISR